MLALPLLDPKRDLEILPSVVAFGGRFPLCRYRAWILGYAVGCHFLSHPSGTIPHHQRHLQQHLNNIVIIIYSIFTQDKNAINKRNTTLPIIQPRINNGRLHVRHSLKQPCATPGGVRPLLSLNRGTTNHHQ